VGRNGRSRKIKKNAVPDILHWYTDNVIFEEYITIVKTLFFKTGKVMLGKMLL